MGAPGINGQIATLEVGFGGNVRRGIAGETRVAGTGFTLGTRASVFFVSLRMEKHRKITAYLLVARIQASLRRGADNDPIFIF